MLPDNLTGVTSDELTFAKKSTDVQAGTLYQCTTSSLVRPFVALFTHSKPKNGSSGAVRHLMSVRNPILDSGNVPTKDDVTVNVTVTYPAGLTTGDEQIAQALSAAVTILTDVVDSKAVLSSVATGLIQGDQ